MKNKYSNLKYITISWCYKTTILIGMILLSTSIAFSQTIDENYIDGELYVKIKDHYKKDFNFKFKSPDIDMKKFPFLDAARKKYNLKIQSSFYFAKSEQLRRTLRISTNDFENIDQIIRDIELLIEVEYAEKVPLNRTSLTPNDLGANTISGQWGLHKIQAQNAWNVTTGSPNIVVAVVDDAIMTNHPDLAGKFVAGRDVSDNDSNTNPPQSYFPHGTHVTGIVGAATSNGTGVASIGYNVKIMPIKASPNSAPLQANCNCVYIYNGYEGIIWAADNGADVINMSWGSYGHSQAGQNIINHAVSQGAVLVAAAGNDNITSTLYPAGYNNVISVAATDINDNKYSNAYGGSNYGPWIDVSAPGVSIKSTVISGGYANWTGTSMASPMVAGLCGLVLSVNPGLSPAQVESCIKTSTDPISSYSGNLGTGRINAHKAVQCAGQGSPDLIISSKSLSTSSVACGSSLTAYATVKNNGNASTGTYSYLRYYLSTNTTWDASDTYLANDYVATLSTGATNNESATLNIPTGLSPGTYYILFRADYSNRVAESNENNNVAYQAINISCVPPQPDLTLNNYGGDVNGTCGNSISLFTTVRNSGTASTGTYSYLGYYLSTNNTLSNDDILLATDYVATLSPGATNGESANVVLPANLNIGTYYILYVADYSARISESNENNNIVYKTINISCTPSQPDLKVTGGGGVTNPTCGNTISVNAIVKNDGTASTGTYSYLGYYLSTNTTLSNDDIFLGNDYVPTLSPGSISNESHSFTLPANLNLGTYYVIFRADYTNRVTESNENNNLRHHTMTVSCSSCITSFPYNEGFESGIGDWTQDTGDNIDWTRRSNGTPSGNTGPSNAVQGTYYMYTEASGANYPSKVANFVSPCFNLSSVTNPILAFKYHMYGASMGTLRVQVSTNNGSTWSTLWTKTGNQGNSWQSASINLNTYTSQTSLMIRFNGTTGTSYTSDMAIDDVSIGEVCGMDNNTLLLLPFDNTSNGTGGETPTTTTGIAYTNGVYNNALSVNNNTALEYLANGNISSQRGTVETWVKPSWNGNDGVTYNILQYGLAGGILITKDGANNLRLILNRWSPSGYPEVGIAHNISNWQAGQWHHIAFTWGNGVMQLYLDGNLVTQGSYNVSLYPISDSEFNIGTDNGNLNWQGAIDHFRISNVIRTQAQIIDFAYNCGATSQQNRVVDTSNFTDTSTEEQEFNTSNYPNPFSQYTTIEYTLPTDNQVTIAVYNTSGKQIAVLHDNELKSAGTHEVIFEANRHSAGIYYYTIQAGEYKRTQKMILMK